MKKSKVLEWILTILGALLIILGLWRLINPIAFFEFSGLVLSADAGLLSEARATGGAVVGLGLLIVLGAFKEKLTYTSTITAIVVFFGFGIARVIGVIIDGNPGSMVIQGLVSEFVAGLIALFAFIKYRD